MLTETTGSSTSQYLWGPGGLVRRDGEWPTVDGLGNTRVVTNGSQSATSNQVPDAYGQTVGSSGSTALPYQWGGSSGYRSDLDAGLTQVGARYYDKDSGRFITRDSDLSQAPYAYCNGDPINYTDPSGHTAKKKRNWWSWLTGAISSIGRSLERANENFFVGLGKDGAIEGVTGKGEMEGAGGAMGVASTVGEGMGATADGLGAIIPYIRRTNAAKNGDLSGEGGGN